MNYKSLLRKKVYNIYRKIIKEITERKHKALPTTIYQFSLYSLAVSQIKAKRKIRLLSKNPKNIRITFLRSFLKYRKRKVQKKL